MTEKYKQAINMYVNCAEKLSRTRDAAQKNLFVWTKEKIATANRICDGLSKQLLEAKEFIINEAKNEEATKEELDWMNEKLGPYYPKQEPPTP